METKELTLGRWKALKDTSHSGDVFGILAFDQRGSYRKMLPEGTGFEEAIDIKAEIVASLSKYTSAVLLDYIYGLRPIEQLANGSGLLIALEKSGYTGDSTARRTEIDENWSSRKIKRLNADAVKLLVYYNPRAGQATSETEALVKDVVQEAHKLDLPVYLEPMTYSADEQIAKDSDEFARIRPDIIAETVERLGSLDPDVLKLEFPVDIFRDTSEENWRTQCRRITDLSPVPWVLLSAGVDFSDFLSQTKVAASEGASGYLAGRAIWKEAVTMAPSERAQFLRTEASKRANQLNELVSGYATPWTRYYTPPKQAEDWYVSYTGV